MLVEIAFRGSTGADDADAEDYRFDVLGWRNHERLRTALVRVENLTKVRLSLKYGSGDESAGATVFRRGAITAGLRRIEALGPALVDSADRLQWSVDYAEIDANISERKLCSNQQRRGGDLFCLAAEKYPAGLGSQARLARTTLHACETACALPDTRQLCSGFVHLEVQMAGSMSAAPSPVLMSRICEMGHQSRIEAPNVRCTPDGHDCWRRMLDLTVRSTEGPLPPLALNEALDFLSWVWRAKFPKVQSKLIHLASASTAAEIGQPCSSPEEFRSRMNALADLLDALKIDGSLNSVPINGTLKRLTDALQVNLPQVEFDRADKALAILRAAAELRNGLHHSDSGKTLPSLARKFGFEWPPANWADAWQQIRDHAARAVREIRQAIETTI